MGLDMHLYERTYCPSVYVGRKKDKQTNFTTKVWDYQENSKKVKFKDVAYITCRKAYWRKANAIHQFFLDKCRGNLDESDCNGRDLYVEKSDLKELKQICEELIKLKGKAFVKRAKELLPTADGFFWGLTEYNQYYKQNLKRTIKVLNGLNLEDGDWTVDYIYNADW